MPNVKFQLSGLTCGACIKSVTTVLKNHDNVKAVLSVDLTSAEIEVDDSSDAVIKNIIEEIADIDYQATVA
jgi:copper chaperone CopZ